MVPTDRPVLLERVAAVERHLARVSDQLPASAAGVVAHRERIDEALSTYAHG